MDINLTREIVEAALSGALDDVECMEDEVFHVRIPKACPGVPDPNILNPLNTWVDKGAFDLRARKLASEFSAHFDKAYGSKNIEPDIARQCPGR